MWDIHKNLRPDSEQDIPDIQSVTPIRLGTHSDWIAIASGYGYILGLAADGGLWYWPIKDSWSYRYNNNFMPLLDISHKPQYLGNVFEGNSGNQ
jgi:hypothetical protein